MLLPEAQADLRARLQEWCAAHGQVGSVAEAEQLAVEVSRVAGQAVVEATLPQTAGQRSYAGCSRPCGCGGRARFVSYRRRWVGTLYGAVAVERAYYHCRRCGTGQAPWDGAQGLTERLWTAGVKALVAQVAARMSYGETVELLGQLVGLRIEESSCEHLVAEVGARVRAREQAEQEQYLTGLAALTAGEVRARQYVSLDGSHAHLDGAWHEVKTGVVYEGVPGAEGVDVAVRPRYVSAPEPAEQFGERLYVAAAQAGVEQAREVIVVGDGAEWIWNLAAHHYPQATQIVDYWHACQHLYALAERQYGESSVRGRRWAQQQCRRLRRDGPAPVRRALRRLRPATPEAAEALRVERGYFTKHAARMQYPQFRRRGLMIGSGLAEAGCKVVVGHRLKQAGMRWTRRGADHILALRCLVLNRDYDRLAQCARAA
jgi:hypothetical protein